MFNFKYLLTSVPLPIARSYLKRNFNWLYDQNENLEPVYLFIAYFTGTPPASYTQAAKLHSRICRIIAGKTDYHAMVICAHPRQFFRLYYEMETLDCAKLYSDITTEFDSLSQKSRFKIGTEVWQGPSPKVMAILNITPDSFYDGGKYFDQKDYSEIVQDMIDSGADIIDIGGESTRPGSMPVSAEEELKRVLPALRQIRQRFHIPVSIDTTKSQVAEAVLKEGANMINDISGLSEGRKMVETVVRHGGSYCLMHVQGKPKTMQKNPHYTDLLAEIYQFLKDKQSVCQEFGLEKERILLDPGIGFGKTVLDNLDLLRSLTIFRNLGSAILIGTSNKAFIGKILGRDLDQRTIGSLATQVMSWLNGAMVFRVHAVAETKDILSMTQVFTNEYQPEQIH